MRWGFCFLHCFLLSQVSLFHFAKMIKLFEGFIHFVSCVPLTTDYFQPSAEMDYNSMLSTGHLLEEALKKKGRKKGVKNTGNS